MEISCIYFYLYLCFGLWHSYIFKYLRVGLTVRVRIRIIRVSVRSSSREMGEKRLAPEDGVRVDTNGHATVKKLNATKIANGGHSNEAKSLSQRDLFVSTFDRLKDSLVRDCLVREAMETGEAMSWMEDMLKYNVPGGKLNRGISVVDTMKVMLDNEFIGSQVGSMQSDEDIDKLFFQARVVGWCIEWLQAFFLVADDMMDGSVTRRGQPCWYKLEHVKMNACNDCILLEAHIYRLLKMFCKDLSCYHDIVELFHEVTYQTSVGQLLDLITAPIGKADLSKYTLDTYKNIVKYKTAFYSFVLPVCCAMLLLGNSEEKAHKTARSILLPMGEYFQVQDDYLDAFGDPKVIGKIGTDIEDSKCSWLIVQVMARANEEQMEIVRKNYGQNDQQSVEAIKQLYRDMEIESVYKGYEEECYGNLTKMIDEQDNLPKDVFTKFLNKIFKRSK